MYFLLGCECSIHCLSILQGFKYTQKRIWIKQKFCVHIILHLWKHMSLNWRFMILCARPQITIINRAKTFLNSHCAVFLCKWTNVALLYQPCWQPVIHRFVNFFTDITTTTYLDFCYFCTLKQQILNYQYAHNPQR